MSTTTQELRALELLTLVSYGRVSTTMRAMPFVAPARHVVSDGDVLLRMHAGHGYHRACAGGVVAYGTDNFNVGGDGLWSVQLTGTAELIEPTAAELELFGPIPALLDDQAYEPVYMRLTPQFFSVHTLDYCAERQDRHAV
jgi:hypothetical protein